MYLKKRDSECKRHILCKWMRKFAEGIEKDKSGNIENDGSNDEEVKGEKKVDELGPENITDLVKKWCEEDIET